MDRKLASVSLVKSSVSTTPYTENMPRDGFEVAHALDEGLGQMLPSEESSVSPVDGWRKMQSIAGYFFACIQHEPTHRSISYIDTLRHM